MSERELMSAPRTEMLHDLRTAEAAYMAGRFTRANELFSELADMRPDDVRLQLRVGQLALYENRLDAAIGALARCAPHGGIALQLLAEAYYRARRFPEAANCHARLGHEAMAIHLCAFGEREPCRSCNGSSVGVAEFLTREPLPLVRVQVNDIEEALFVFDTGAWDSVISNGFARRIGLPRGGRGVVGCADGRDAQIEYGCLDCLGIGALRIADVPVQVMDLDQALAGFFEPHGVDGVLGLGVLSRFNVTLDMPAGVLRLTPHKHTAADGTPFWLGGGRQMLVWGEINRLPNLWFLDTGMTGFDCLLPASTAMHASLQRHPSQLATGYGGGGQVTLAAVGVDDLQLDAVRKTPATGVVTPAFPLEHCYGFRIGGLLAFEFFQHSVLEIDFAAMRLRVRTPLMD